MRPQQGRVELLDDCASEPRPRRTFVQCVPVVVLSSLYSHDCRGMCIGKVVASFEERSEICVHMRNWLAEQQSTKSIECGLRRQKLKV